MSHRILLVDDEIDILEFVRYNLQKEGYEVFTAQNGAEALKAAAKYRPHLILLDMMMPVMDGAQTCRAIRQDPQLRDTMVVFLSALGEEGQQLAGFDVGADDYLTKPFDLDELQARIEVQRRHHAERAHAGPAVGAAKADGSSQLLAFRRWELDPDGRVFCVDGKEVALTRTEFNILELLMGRPQKVFTKQELFELAWGEPYSVEDSTVNVHVSNLRRKLKPTGTDGYLQTVWGMGYKLHNA